MVIYPNSQDHPPSAGTYACWEDGSTIGVSDQWIRRLLLAQQGYSTVSSISDCQGGRGGGFGERTMFFCLGLIMALFRSCLMATKMRTRSPTFLIPISCKIFWSQSMRLSPLKLLAARCQRPSTLHTQSQGDVITSEDRLILAAFDTMQPRDHLLLIPSPGFVIISILQIMSAYPHLG